MCTLSLVGLIMTLKALAKRAQLPAIDLSRRALLVSVEERAKELKQDLKKEKRKWVETLKSRGLKTESYPKLHHVTWITNIKLKVSAIHHWPW